MQFEKFAILVLFRTAPSLTVEPEADNVWPACIRKTPAVQSAVYTLLRPDISHSEFPWSALERQLFTDVQHADQSFVYQVSTDSPTTAVPAG